MIISKGDILIIAQQIFPSAPCMHLPRHSYFLLFISFSLSLSLSLFLLLTFSTENRGWDYALLWHPTIPPPHPLFTIAVSEYSLAIFTAKIIGIPLILSTVSFFCQGGEEKKKKQSNRTTSSAEAAPTHRLLRRPDFFFFLFFGRGDGELLNFLFTLNWQQQERGREIESEIQRERERGKNHLQVIVMIIIFRRNEFLIIVICCCSTSISVYFLISSIHSAITCHIIIQWKQEIAPGKWPLIYFLW